MGKPKSGGSNGQGAGSGGGGLGANDPNTTGKTKVLKSATGSSDPQSKSQKNLVRLIE